MTTPQAIVGWFLEPDTTAREIYQEGLKPLTLRNEEAGAEVTLHPLLAAAHLGVYRRLEQALVETDERTQQGTLDAAYYAVPFHLKGWSWREIVMRVLMFAYDVRLQQSNKIRRRKAVPKDAVPTNITQTDIFAILRGAHPPQYRALIGAGRRKVRAYIRDPDRAFEVDLDELRQQGHVELNGRTVRLLAQCHAAPLLKVLEEKTDASLALFVPLETAVHVAVLLYEHGFRPPLEEVNAA